MTLCPTLSCDRLAQRNLAIVESDNPGIASTHVVQHTLLLKPSKASLFQPSAAGAARGDTRSLYDELVIRWNDIPRDTVASLADSHRHELRWRSLYVAVLTCSPELLAV
jgi:hypothetical protein